MTKYKKSTSLGKAGSIGFNQKEAKEIRKNFIPLTNLDHLALYLDGTKFSPESFDRFFDSNLRKKGAQAFNLLWIKKGGAKVDQLALSIQNDVQGYNNVDESRIIDDIVLLVSSYPAGFTEYYFDRIQEKTREDEYYNNANFSDMDNEIEREQANEAFEADLKKSFKPKTRLKRTVKTVTKTVTKRKTVNKTKQAYTPELAILKRFFALHNKPVKITQLTSLQSGLKAAIATGKNHLQLIKTINAKLNVAIIKLQNANIGNIKKFEISKDLLAKVNAVVTAPKVKQVTLGGLKNHQKQYNKEVDAYKWFVINPIEKKALTGFEFKSDAIDALHDYDEYCKVVAKSSLKKLGIPDPSESWKHKDTSKKKGNLGTVEMNLQQYLNQENPIKEVRVILDEKDYKLGYLYKFSPYKSVQQIFITNPQFVKEHGGIEYVLKNGGNTLYTTDGDGNAKRPSVFVIDEKATTLGTPKKSVKGNWTLADKKKLAKELGHEFYNAEDWRKLTAKEKPSSKKKSSLGSFTSEHKEAIKEAANDVKTAGDLLAKAKKNKESVSKIAQLKKGLDKYTEIYLNLLAKMPKKQGLDRSQTSLFKNESKPQTSLFGDALHGIEQYTEPEMKELGISYNNSLNGVGKGKKSPYDIINEKLISLLKGGDIPWINQRSNAPIKGEDGMLRNYITKRPYSGVNVIMLNSFMEPHHNSFFLTKKQIEARGGNLNKGAKGFQIIFTKKLTVTDNKPATATTPATSETKQVFMLNTYVVYNSADTDLKLREEKTAKTEKQVIQSCETIYPNMPKKPVLKFGGTRAFYVPEKDYVQLPNQDNFTTLQGYYRTLFHELAHSTGHKSRLNRKFDSWTVSKRDYAIEELVAEIASSYICGYTGIYFANEQKHASYLNHYLKELHGSKLEQYKADLVLQAQTDKTFLLHAIGAAQKAANYILSKQLQNLKKAKKPTKTKSTNLGNAQNEVTEALPNLTTNNRQPSTKSPFQTMDKLVSGGTYQLAGERGKLLGNLGQVDCSITIRGDQGAGKSQLMWQLVNDFASIGKRVAVVSPEMNGSSPTISKYRDKYITPENSSKILFTDKKLTVKQIKDLSNAFDVVFVDSFNQLENYEQSQFDWLCKQLPNKCIVGLFQSTTGGEMRGGNKPEFDAYVNIEVVKVDDSFINNYAVCTKNRFGGTGAKYNISTQKIIKESTNGLNGVAKKRAAKKTVKKVTKSVEASKVLKLMDDDYSYQDALKLVLSNNKNIDKTKLEKELNKYI